jgi:hypothetical protein
LCSPICFCFLVLMFLCFQPSSLQSPPFLWLHRRLSGQTTRIPAELGEHFAFF